MGSGDQRVIKSSVHLIMRSRLLLIYASFNLIVLLTKLHASFLLETNAYHALLCSIFNSYNVKTINSFMGALWNYFLLFPDTLILYIYPLSQICMYFKLVWLMVSALGYWANILQRSQTGRIYSTENVSICKPIWPSYPRDDRERNNWFLCMLPGSRKSRWYKCWFWSKTIIKKVFKLILIGSFFYLCHRNYYGSKSKGEGERDHPRSGYRRLHEGTV